MLRVLVAMLGLCGLLFAGVTLAADTNEQMLKKLLGRWDIEEGVNQGVKVSEDELEGSFAVIEEGVIVTYDKHEKELYRAKFTINVNTSPIQIDMVTAMKDMPAAKAFGIIKCDEDDEFVLCYALPGAERPTDFKSPKNSKIMLFELEREDH